MKKNWISTLEKLPQVGQRVWYHYAWIGTFDGTYLGEKHCEFEDCTYPYFESSGGTWRADCETFWCEWTEEKPDPPEESIEHYKAVEEDNRIRRENLSAINVNDVESIAEFLESIKNGKLECEKGCEILIDVFDQAWEDGYKSGRGSAKNILLKFSGKA